VGRGKTAAAAFFPAPPPAAAPQPLPPQAVADTLKSKILSLQIDFRPLSRSR
jgi:hypothetical protein